MDNQINKPSTNRNQNENCAPTRNSNLNLNFNTHRSNENMGQTIDVAQNINNTLNIINPQNESEKREKYSRFFKVLSMVIETIFCISFVVFENVIKKNDEIYNAHYTGIVTISSFFFIFLILFIAEIIAFCVFDKRYSIFGTIFFWVSQIFYFIDYIMVPSYYSRLLHITENEIKEISFVRKRYIALIIVSLIFTLFIIFFDFIIINLYQDLCCKMDEICEYTFMCLDNFGKCVKDIISRVICQSKNEEDEEIKKIVEESEDQIKQMKNLNEEIKHLLSQHINIVIKNHKII